MQQYLHVILHNICLDFDDDLIREYVEEGMEAIMHNEQEEIMNEMNEEKKRLENERQDALCRELYCNGGRQI